MSTDGQRTKWHRNIAENFNRLSRVHKRYRQTDRQTDDDTCSLKIDKNVAELLMIQVINVWDVLSSTTVSAFLSSFKHNLNKFDTSQTYSLFYSVSCILPVLQCAARAI